MPARIQQAPLGILPVDFNKHFPDIAHQARAHPLIIDTGAAAAIRSESATEDQRLPAIDLDLGQQFERRMIGRQMEFSRNASLLRPGANKARIGPHPKRQREAVQQDGFSGACLPRQNAQPFFKGNIQPVDQDNIADGEFFQHVRRALKDCFPGLDDP